MECNGSRAKTQKSFGVEIKRIKLEVKKGFNLGKDVCVFTLREYYKKDFQNENSDKYLIFSSRI